MYFYLTCPSLLHLQNQIGILAMTDCASLSTSRCCLEGETTQVTAILLVGLGPPFLILEQRATELGGKKCSWSRLTALVQVSKPSWFWFKFSYRFKSALNLSRPVCPFLLDRNLRNAGKLGACRWRQGHEALCNLHWLRWSFTTS